MIRAVDDSAYTLCQEDDRSVSDDSKYHLTKFRNDWVKILDFY